MVCARHHLRLMPPSSQRRLPPVTNATPRINLHETRTPVRPPRVHKAKTMPILILEYSVCHKNTQSYGVSLCYGVTTTTPELTCTKFGPPHMGQRSCKASLFCILENLQKYLEFRFPESSEDLLACPPQIYRPVIHLWTNSLKEG